MSIINIVSIICFAFCILIFIYLKWYVKKRTSISNLLDAEYRKDVNKLIADINNAADRDSLLVEERIKQLRIILEETDKRISFYEKILEEIPQKQSSLSRSNETLYTSLGRGIKAALSAETVPEKKQEPPVIFPAPIASVMPAAFNAPIASAMPVAFNVPIAPAMPAASATPSKPPSRKQIRTHIDLLLNEGVSPEEIASQLEISIAEVNLAMNLRRVKK